MDAMIVKRLAPVLYYKYFDSERGTAVFGRKDDAPRLSNEIAATVHRHLSSMGHDVEIVDGRLRLKARQKNSEPDPK